MKKVKCLKKRYANFIYGKTYTAEPMGFKVKTNMPVNFRIKDEDGDYYTVAKDLNNIERGWVWTNEEVEG